MARRAAAAGLSRPSTCRSRCTCRDEDAAAWLEEVLLGREELVVVGARPPPPRRRDREIGKADADASWLERGHWLFRRRICLNSRLDTNPIAALSPPLEELPVGDGWNTPLSKPLLQPRRLCAQALAAECYEPLASRAKIKTSSTLGENRMSSQWNNLVSGHSQLVCRACSCPVPMNQCASDDGCDAGEARFPIPHTDDQKSDFPAAPFIDGDAPTEAPTPARPAPVLEALACWSLSLDRCFLLTG